VNPVEISKLHFRYPGTENNIIDGIDLVLKSGEILSVLGLSGCGKSTLCYCICGIIPHVYEGELGGNVRISGRDVSVTSLPVLSTEIGIVFQDPDTQLFSPTVEDEIAFGPENLCLDRVEIRRRIDKNLRLVGMEKYRFAHPEKLSGGEKQLIAIASVLALEPKIIIFDESLSQIDTHGKKDIKNVISRIRNEGRSIIMVEHDIYNLDIADRVFFMKNGKLYPVENRREEEIFGFYKV